MKTIQIQSLELQNFKGVKNQQATFAATTRIEGPNHSGKTTIADAFFWVLFHKDSQGRTQFGIKTLDPEGNEIHRLQHQVTLTLKVDGRPVKFHKCYHEDWVKPKGQTQEQMKGHTVEYAVDEVPCTLKEYDQKVRDVIDEQTFRILTDVLYFSSMKWQEQKQILRALAGSIDLNANHVLDDKRFCKLIEYVNGGGTLEEYERYVRAQQKPIRERLDQIPSEVEGKEQTIVDVNLNQIDDDTRALESRKTQLKAELDKVNANIEDANARANAYVQQRNTLLSRINLADNQLNQCRTDLNRDNIKAYNDAMEIYQAYQRALIRTTTDRANLTNRIKTEETYIASLQKSIAKAGEDWKAENARQWQGSETCPTCGQPLPDEAISEAKANFAENKKQQLDAILKVGNQLRSEINAKTADLDKMRSDLAAIQDPAEVAEPTLAQANPDDNPTYRKLTADRAALQAELDSMAYTDSSQAYKQERQNIQAELDTIDADLRDLATLRGKHEVNLNTQSQIEKLQQEQQRLTVALAQWEREQETINLYRQNEVQAIEQTVNSHFHLARFRFYRPLVNGGYDETCECTMHGTPYASLSASERVNVGIDIINALQQHYQAVAPIFIDNAEGVTTLEPTQAQTVCLYVKDCKQLTINNNLF